MMKPVAGLVLVATLAGCVGYARYEYIEASPETLHQELTEQQKVVADVEANRNYDTQIYETHSRFGLFLCRSNGEEIVLKTAELQGEQICGTVMRRPEALTYVPPDPPKPQTACIPVDQIELFGSPHKTITFGMYPLMGETPSCPE